MEIRTADFVWHASADGDASAQPLVLLHGFAQSSNSFAMLTPLLSQKYRVITLDLPGHGEAELASTTPIAWPMLCRNVLDAIAQIDARPAHWFGYSQGGRVALMCALTDAQHFKSLALLGASCGIADEQARAMRVQSDRLLGQNIVGRGMEWFTEYWEALPIFATQKWLPASTRQLIRSERMSCAPSGLKLALESYGTGTMPDCFARLSKWSNPLLLAAGELDTKFVESNQRIVNASLSPLVQHHVIKNAGHAAHLEQPELFAKLLRNFIQASEGLY